MADDPQVAEYKSRKVGLILFGIAQLLLGLACALLVPLMILGALGGVPGVRADLRPHQIRARGRADDVRFVPEHTDQADHEGPVQGQVDAKRIHQDRNLD